MNSSAKVLMLTMLTLFATSFKTAEEIKWVDFNTGYALAKKKNKIMLVDVYTDWCGWCKRMDRDAYAKPRVAELINKDYVAIKFNPEIEGAVYSYEGKNYTGPQLAAVIGKNQITGYPTTVFINPNAKSSELVVGYKNEEQMIQVLKDIKQRLGK